MKICTWNINSVRLREGLVAKLMAEEQPDVLCLQECKSPVDKIPLEQFQALGYRYMVARGQKGYNGVAILSKLPITDAGDKDFLSCLNPGSIQTIQGWLEPGTVAEQGVVTQFERLGYFVADSKDSTAQKPVFNRVTTLKDTWAAGA